MLCYIDRLDIPLSELQSKVLMALRAMAADIHVL